MAPSRSFRTYSRGTNSSLSGVEAMNILFAKNLTERKLHNKIKKGKNKIQIKELPKKIKSVLREESSLHVNIDDTFDNLMKGSRNNNNNKSNSISVKIIARNTSSSVIKHFSKLNNFSPMLSKLRSFKDKSQNSEEASTCSWFKQVTPSDERVTNDLEIEKIGKTEKKVNRSRKAIKHDSSRDSPILLRSRAKLPEILVTDASSIKKDADESKVNKEASESNKIATSSSILDPNLSYNPIFTNSVREKILLHSSTPLVSNKITRLVKQPISPIKNVEDEVNSYILESVEEIKSWDGTFPNIKPQSGSAGTADVKSLEEKDEVGQDQLDLKRNSFITVRGHQNKVSTDLDKNNSCSDKPKSFSLEEFELFFNKFKTNSFKMEDFERFHSSLTQQQLTNKLTQNQVTKLNSISLKDFESFYSAWQNRISLNEGSFLSNSHRTINYVTNRKHRLSHRISLSKKSINLSKKYLKLSKQFDLKNLIVVLDNILVKNTTDKMKKSKSLCQTAVMNSILQKQPVVNLTRLSIKAANSSKPSFKAKNRLSFNGYTACRKFSSNYTPKRHSDLSSTDTVPTSDICDIGQLFINVTRMPLNGILSPKIKEVKDNVTTRKARSSEKNVNNSRGSGRLKENDSTSEKENEKSRYRKFSKSHENRKSFVTNHGKKNSSSSPDKSSNHKNRESKLNSEQARKSKISDTNRKSKMWDCDESYSDDERTSIKLSFLSESVKRVSNRKTGGEKEYVAKILVGSVSDTELELKSTNNSLLGSISRDLMGYSQESFLNSSTFSYFRRRTSPRVLHSSSSKLVNSSLHDLEKTGKCCHGSSPESLKLGLHSELSKTYRSDDDSTYTVQDLSNSILSKKQDDVASSNTGKLRDIIVNLTLHESFDKVDSVNNVTVTRKSTDSMRKSQDEETNLDDDETENKTKHEGSPNLNSSIPILDLTADDTPKNIRHSKRLSARKSLCCEDQDLAKSVDSTVSESDIVESSINSPNGDLFKAPLALQKWKQKVPKLKAGKSWRRSLLMHKRDSVVDVIDLTRDFSNASSRLTDSSRKPSLMPLNMSAKRQSIKMVPLCDPRLSRRNTVLQTYAHSNLSIILDDSVTDLTNLTPRKPKLSLEKSLPLITAKDIVLKRCGQTEPRPFAKIYPKTLLKDCKKIGEGVYGEVFLYTNPTGDTTVMKVIPIEGDKLVNQERQKKFDEILSEIVIASELSKLRGNTTNQTSAFSEVQRICCVTGKYPKVLVDLWEEYDNSKGSENDHPRIFDDEQLYIVLDLANGGRDLEAFVFNSALQAMSMFKQVACALAVAEQQLEFEHRDLHWGNVLLKSVDKHKKVTCKHKGNVIKSQTEGVEVTIIDFTLSRIVHDGVVIFNDLAQDPDLFVAEGDYQFEIYRLMRKKNSNNWQKSEPHTNVLWLHYILDKSITALRYKNTKTKIHKKNIDCLKEYEKIILNFESASEFVNEYY